jgi:hypothetical protein
MLAADAPVAALFLLSLVLFWDAGIDFSGIDKSMPGSLTIMDDFGVHRIDRTSPNSWNSFLYSIIVKFSLVATVLQNL